MNAYTKIEATLPSNEAAQRALLSQYASERLATLRRRFVVYIFGCLFAVWATSLPVGLGLTGLVVAGDVVDCLCLLSLHRQISQGAHHSRLMRFATFGGMFQCLSLTVSVAAYVLIWGQEGTILGVAAVLGMEALNATLLLPTNRKVAIRKLAICAITPILLLVIELLLADDRHALMHLSAHSLMALMCMGYMCYSFSRSSYENAQKTEDLRKNEQALSAANTKLHGQQDQLRKLSMVARSSNDTVILMSADRTVEWVNEAFTDLSGVSFQEAVGRNIYDLIRITDSNADDFDEVAAAAKRGAPLRTELHNRQNNGRDLWIDFQLLPIKSAAGDIEFFVTIARDITAVKEHSESLRQAREAAEEVAKAKSSFLANMSHEIRTPLTGIIGMADLLTETEQSPEQRTFTQTIVSSSRSLLTIINDILDLSKLDAGKLALSDTRFETRSCFGDVIRLLTPAAQEKGNALKLWIDDGVPAQLISDDVRLRQITTNIVGNATKFTEGGCIDVRVWTSADAAGSMSNEAMLNVAVEDTGIGIPEDRLQSIFDEFSQADGSTSRRFGGTGLGLAICRKLVAEMGGKIDLQSTVGAGTSVRISLPVKVPASAEDADATAPAMGGGDLTDLAGFTILVADDNKTNRFLMRKYLEPLPLTLHFVENGYDAVEAALEHMPDLIFMDISMPIMSGLEVTETIRANAEQQPCIVALTAHVLDGEQEACLAAGMNDFLTKPIRRQQIVDCLRQHLAQKNKSNVANYTAVES
ncbi:PAS domain-containing hybrid sensor histidine kinase/response regulator [Shimia sp. MMG029]|uniref:PAS domain-containing hybrid sensor histidine kinase/response regulator n=1 Tax=Shimia sp. MMG029 TaxID=3021978 RepID=UPI0022FEA023|nr:ATP-binding protein [Shimia sp. MMG029]MDA5557603.1 ATP-binding protein [Shimia sp. MMG029]